MLKNSLIVVLFVVAAFAGYKWYMYRAAYRQLMAQAATQSSQKTPTAPLKGLTMPKTGENFSSTPAYSHAYQIFPGQLTSQAQQAINGFDMKTSDLADGSTKITLTSKDQTDQSQSYTVKSGQKLYFVEMVLRDDANTGHDINLHDDYGVIVDGNGMVVR